MMRSLIMTLLALGLAGCGVELLTTTAIQGELQARQATAASNQVRAMSDSMARTNIKRAIDTYHAEKGYYPASLTLLVPHYLPSLPTKSDGMAFGYDPRTGALLDGAQGNAPHDVPSNQDRMNQIRAAIDQYGQATGYYPATLQTLVPNYLTEVPRTVSGMTFGYNAQDGALWVPEQPRRAPEHAVSGNGPMGEVSTGMAIQRELNSQSNAGVNAGGSRGRRSINTHTQKHNARQEKALKDLGL